jgi:hypothetical protein
MLAFTGVRAASTLDEELESRRLEVWFVLTLAFTRLSELSMLEEEFERLKLDV